MKRSCCSKASIEGSRGFDRGGESEKGAVGICGSTGGSSWRRPFGKRSRSGGDGEVIDFFFFLSRFLMTPSRFGDSWVASAVVLIRRKSAPDDFRRMENLGGDALPITLK